MQVEAFLEQRAQRSPGKTALVCGGRRFTYQEIDRTANRVANALIGRGVKRGDRVAIQLENSWEAAVSIFGILKAGAVFLILDPSTKSDKVEHILNDCAVRVLITDSERLARLEHRPPEVMLTGADFAAGDELCPPKHCIDIDLAALIYTSGSTGKPKGVMLTHLNIVSAATSVTSYLENNSDDIILNSLPLSFGYGLYQLLMAFKIGGTLVLERGFTFPRAILNQVQRENVTGLPLVPTMAALLLQTDLSGFQCPSLRYITNAAAALPVSQIARLRAALPHVTIYSMYGLTECQRVSYLPPQQLDRRPDSVGRGMPNEEVYIVDEHGRRVGPGVIGELVVRGSNVMKGYWGMPEATDAVLKPGPLPGERVLYTGDLFRADDEGYLYFVGRKDDIIKTRGEKVSPKEVEETLYRIDGVAEAAVIGVPDAVLGEAIKAMITLRAGVTLSEKDILSHCARHLEDFMVPKYVEFHDSLPKSANGKINKRELATAGTR
jgi:long-chain acyl-CoA synthetase